MKTMAFVGGLHGMLAWAERVADRVRRLNDFPCTVLNDDNAKYFSGLLKMPAWIKAYLWDLAPPDVERILWFDADMMPLRPLGELPRDPFSACPNLMREGTLAKQFPILQWWEKEYFNSGFFIATRATEPAFRILKSFMYNVPRQAWPMYEQSWLNLAIVATLRCYHQLPHTYNWSVKRHKWEIPDDVLTIHYPGMTFHDRNKHLNEAWEKYEKELPA